MNEMLILYWKKSRAHSSTIFYDFFWRFFFKKKNASTPSFWFYSEYDHEGVNFRKGSESSIRKVRYGRPLFFSESFLRVWWSPGEVLTEWIIDLSPPPPRMHSWQWKFFFEIREPQEICNVILDPGDEVFSHPNSHAKSKVIKNAFKNYGWTILQYFLHFKFSAGVYTMH